MPLRVAIQVLGIDFDSVTCREGRGGCCLDTGLHLHITHLLDAQGVALLFNA